MDNSSGTNINCACVIHGSVYSWIYVERLYNMLLRNLSRPVTLHVYTEPDRHVPNPFVKHELIDLGIAGPKKGWWYKIQLFNDQHYSGPLLYFDLDTVITDNIDWITEQSLDYFWAPRDFKKLWRPSHAGINSSVMWWDTTKFSFVWDHFQTQSLPWLQRRYPGDQDYLSDTINNNRLRYLDETKIRSWKWECVDGGWDFKKRQSKAPNTGTHLNGASVLVFHGQPNPCDVRDPVILTNWC